MFWLDRAAARDASVEVLANNLKMSDAEIMHTMSTRFESVWRTYELGTGKVDPVTMAGFMRAMAENRYVPGLYVKKPTR